MFVFNLCAFACWIISATGRTKWFLYISYSLQGFFGALAYNCVGEIKYVWLKKKEMNQNPISISSFIESHKASFLYRSLHRRDSSCINETLPRPLPDYWCFPWWPPHLHNNSISTLENKQGNLELSSLSSSCICHFTVWRDTSLACEKGEDQWGKVCDIFGLNTAYQSSITDLLQKIYSLLPRKGMLF